MSRHSLPFHPEYVEDLDMKVERYRIYKVDDDDPWIDDDGVAVPYCWQVDGYAIVDGLIALTAWCENFPTHRDALRCVLTNIAEDREAALND